MSESEWTSPRAMAARITELEELVLDLTRQIFDLQQTADARSCATDELLDDLLAKRSTP